MPSTEKPVLHYGFLCDGAMEVQGKWTFQGLFTNINCTGFPTLIPESKLAFRFSGPVGAHILEIRLVKQTDLKTLFARTKKPVECKEFSTNDVVMSLRNLPLPTEGFYAFYLHLDDNEPAFGSIEFRASAIKPPKADS